jgi:hypothetical protein
LRDELFVDADQIAAAAIHPLENLIAVGLGLFGAVNPRHRRVAGLEDDPHRSPRDLQGPGDLPDAVALRS